MITNKTNKRNEDLVLTKTKLGHMVHFIFDRLLPLLKDLIIDNSLRVV